ncbi:MAG: hypothetical protein RE468_04510 [Acidithiobacillus caldus]|uniref:hypothetical protein n=1 Tax=Acidithiobacillus caldus TaxID=33059 RepID=UPI0028164E48|nr:hypothetical protein [Acidithiobacillus caldus]WMT47880.1 MAG: hypothetical protein RE468_04510 [Acidithiobacillus caldus]
MSFNTKLFLFWLAGVFFGPILIATNTQVGFWLGSAWLCGPVVFWFLRWFSGLSMKGYGEYSHWDIQKAREEGRQQGYNNGYHNGRNS